MNKNKIIQQIEKDQMSKELPEFGPGDSVVVQVKLRKETVKGSKHLKV